MTVHGRTRALAGMLLLVNAVQHLVVEAASAMAWPGDRYSYARDFVSDLGANACGAGEDGACSPLHAAMNTSFLLNGLLFLCAALLLVRLLNRRQLLLSILAAIYAAGMAAVAAVQRSPESVADGTYALHVVGAALALGVGNLIPVLAGVESRRIGAPAWYRTASIALGVAGLVGLAGIGLLSGEQPAPVLERLSVYAINLWWLLTGGCLVVAHLRRHSA